ncbi:MAG: S8 family serine peptidase [Bacteroidales bacterium]|nr:S8 family serine peptidase [Bacteroidales bacterium]
MKTKALAILLMFVSFIAGAQISPDKYFVRFTDKNNSPYSIDNPLEFLSQRALDRRLNQDIPVDVTDLPVNPIYLQGLAAAGATILNPSKWLNGVTIFTDNPTVIDTINALPYVAGVTKSPKPAPSMPVWTKDFEKPFFKHEIYQEAIVSNLKQGFEMGIFDYGMGLNQIQMLNGDVLHEMGYRGQGKVIAVIDAGFYNANVLDVFDSLWQNSQILGTRDFVYGGEMSFDGHPHGSMVLSLMGGNYPGQLIGTAPKASYWLLHSEDGNSEYIIEEYNWVSAAEFADSVGADVINSSLGYTEFDDPAQNHTYADMDGDTAPSTIGGDMAAKKGILVVNSLGNSGTDAWYYLGAPSDGDSVMGIGAVDGSGNYAAFSSHGPSYDGRVKPDVVAQGSDAYVADPYGGGFGYGSGTSFSSPILAGMAACLWQANPTLSNMQIADAIRQSASQYLTPDDMLGFGIPDFVLANNILTIIDGPDGETAYLKIYPNPFRDVFTVDAGNHGGVGARMNEGIIEISDITGRFIGLQKVSLINSATVTIDLLQNAPKGLYFVKVNLNGFQSVQKVIKR